MAGYQKLDVLLREELDAFYEEGYDIDKQLLGSEIDAAVGDKEKLMAIYNRLLNADMRSDFPYSEPSELEEIFAQSKPNSARTDEPVGDFNKFYGAWLGRCIGCALGQPVELWSHLNIRKWFEKAGKYPIDGYVPTHSPAEADGLRPGVIGSTDEHIKFMGTDDDLRYTVLGLVLLNSKGANFDTYDVGANWVYRLPYRDLCTAENQAYLNFANVDEFGPWGKPENAMEYFRRDKVSTYLNPYREWIGAQIRIDAYAYAAAGNPMLAAKMAHTDAYLSHTKNGIYGAMFFAALIAAAFSEKDIDKCIETALSFIPEKSRFYEMVSVATDIGRNAKSDDELIEKVQALYPGMSWVHTLNNAALCIACITYSKGSFSKAVSLSVACGLDTDCNGATVGSFMGALLGETGIDDKWKAPLNDTLYSGVLEYNPVKISEIAHKTMEIHRRVFSEI